MLFIILQPGKQVFFPLAEAFSQAFQELGVDNRIVFVKSHKEILLKEGDFLLAVGANDFEESSGPRSFCYQTEHLRTFPGQIAHLLKKISSYEYWIDFSRTNIEFFNEKMAGKDKRFYIPLGYSPVFDATGSLPEIERFECAFCGGMNQRRQKILDKISQALHCTGFWGRNFYALARSSKINLNVHAYDNAFENPRIIQVLSNKGFLITEYSEEIGQVFENKKQLIWGKAEELPELVKYYLAHEGERKRIAQQGYDWARNEFSLKRKIEESGILRVLK